jgi:outer membrane protein assembly factor BamC
MMTVSCSYIPTLDKILPDKSKDYQKSESLPDLAVPPDLTAEAGNDSMMIPNEGASLSEYQQKRSGDANSSQAAPRVVESRPDEYWVSVRGNNRNIWPRLRAHLTDSGYNIDMEDAERGVMETSWAEPFIEDGFSYRDKFKIVSEPDADPNLTALFVTNQRQVLAIRQDGTDSWSDKEKSGAAEKMLAGSLNLFFNGTRDAMASKPTSAGGQQKATPRKKSLVQSAGDGKDYLAIPEEFTRVWRHTEIALERAGLPISSKDQARGIYNIVYFDASAEKKEGFLSKLKFWGDDAPEGVPFQISLTGVGDKTELIILNAEGEWATDNNALQIMAIIQGYLNR